MSLSLFRHFGLAGSGLVATAFAFPLTAGFAQEEREIVIQRVVVEEKEEKSDGDKEKKSFWIGVALEGSEGVSGLTIADVLPDSPAKKSGLQAGDVLVAIGDRKLERLEQLVDSVQDSQGRTLKVKFLRDGQELVREVKPGKRPEIVGSEEQQKPEPPKKTELNRYAPKPGQPEAKPAQPGIAWQRIEIPKTGTGPQGGSGTMHLYQVPKGASGAPTAGGGSAFPPSSFGSPSQPMMARLAFTQPSPQLPDDMEVTVSKKGNKPAVITVRQGEKLWKTTENELGMLPPPAQAYAAKMLAKDVRARMPGGGAPGMGGGMMMQGMSGGPGGMPGMSDSEGGMPGMPGGAIAPREMQRIELRLNKNGEIESMQGTKNAPQVKVLPGGGIQVEIHEGKEEKKGETIEKPAAEKGDPARADRIRVLQLQAEQLRELLDKLKAEVKEKK